MAKFENSMKILMKLEFSSEIDALEKNKTEDGKTDMEMYELNYFEELIQKHMLDAKSDILSMGHIIPQKMKTLIQSPASLDRAVNLNLITEQAREAVKQLQSPITPFIPMLAMLENK